MKVVKSLSIKFFNAFALFAVSSSVFAQQVNSETSSDMGSMVLFSAGMVGLAVARKHIKQ